MLHDKRDFRAIIFSSPVLNCVSAIEDLLAVTPALGVPEKVRIPGQHPAIEAFRTTYFSKKCYLRTFDVSLREEYARMEKDGEPFEYRIFMIVDHRSSPPLVFLAVPFAAMAVEVFGRIHERRPDTSFQYLRPFLSEIVSKLKSDPGSIKGLRTEAMNWLIAGDSGRCDQIALRGRDVAHSVVFDWLTVAMRGNGHYASPLSEAIKKGDVEELALTLRGIEVRYDDEGGQELLRLSADRFGNYTVWVTNEGAALPLVFEVVGRLRAQGFMIAETKFPVRDRRNEPLL